jgi:5-formyltetrahydrofolate cyclo-ligase
MERKITMKLEEAKKKVRQEIADRAKLYSKEWVITQSKAIQEHILGSEEYQKADVIFCYVSFGKEVDTFPILEDALQSGKKVGVPLCIQKGIMEVREIKSLKDLRSGAYGILEPQKDTPLLAKEEIQYAIIPCVTCDVHGNRMGHGAGYYDRYLEGTDLLKAILCFDELMMEEVPVSELDVPMNQVISQSGIRRITK